MNKINRIPNFSDRIIFLFGFLVLAHLVSAQTITYVPFYNSTSFDAKSTNINLAVGSTAGQASVSNGSATYSIPIMSPPRPKGAPAPVSVSLNYNSSGGDGPLGRGWGLSTGVSVISRAQKTIAIDGVTEPSCTSKDEFTLDGARLIRDNNTTIGSPTEYWHTESENFSEIISTRNSNNTIEEWTITTKSGIVYYYNTNSHYSQKAFNSTSNNLACNTSSGDYVNYYLDLYMSTNGKNYTSYLYNASNDKFAYVTEIIDVYGSTIFNYKTRSDKNHIYQNGKLFKSEWLLDNIEVKNTNGDLLRKYTCQYSFDGINSFLSEVQEIASDGVSKLNPIIFKYGDRNPDQTVIDYTLNSTQSPNILMGVNYYIDEKIYQSGDFNGDGFTDVLEIMPNITSTNNEILSFKVFINNKNNTYTEKFFEWGLSNIVFNKPDDNYNYLYITDFDGNGVDDILLNEINTSGPKGSHTLLNTRIYYFDESGNHTIVNKAPPVSNVCNGTTTNFNYITFGGKYNFYQDGDYDGDGNMDYMFFISNGSCGVKCFVSYPSKNIYNQLFANNSYQGSSFIPTLISNSTEIIILDFNGDGKSDIMTVNANNSNIYKTEGNELILIYSSTFPNSNYKIYQGDFNGDRKTDLLTSIGNNNWETWLSTSNKFELYAYPDLNTFYDINSTPYCNSFLNISDFNGDGKSDILQISKSNVSQCGIALIRLNYSTGSEFKVKFNEMPNSGGITNVIYPKDNMCNSKTLIGDFNGDGKSDLNIEVKLIINSNPCEFDAVNENMRKHIYFDENGNELVLEKVKNGFGVVSEFKYETMSRMPTYVKNYNNSSTYQGNNYVNLPAKLVSKFFTEDHAGNHELKFNYKGGLINKKGYGFLGFREIETVDELLDRKSISYTNKFNSSSVYPQLLIPDYSEIIRLSDGVILGSNKSTYDFISKGTNRYWLKKTKDESMSYLSGNSSIDYIYDATVNNNLTKTTTTDDAGNTSINDINYGSSSSLLVPFAELMTKTYNRAGKPSISYSSKFEYNSNNEIAKIHEYWGLPNQITKEFEYNNLGLITKETIKGTGTVPRVNETIYDPKDESILTKTRNSLGQEVIYNTNKWYSINSVTGINGLTTTNLYDVWGNLTKTTLPTGKVIEYFTVWDNSISNPNGLPSIFKSYSLTTGPTTYSFYDKLGRNFHTKSQISNGNYVSAYQIYDIKGNTLESSSYDNSGQLITKSSSTYDEFNRIKDIYKYDVNNTALLVSSTNYNKNASTWEYTTTIPGSTSNTAGRTSFKKTKLTGELIESSENGTNTLTYEYNAEGKTTKTKQGTTVLSEVIYDVYGRQEKLIDNSAGLQIYEYTPLGELYKQTNANGGFSKYTYDILGRKIKEVINEGEINYTYYPTGTGAAKAKTGKLQKVTGYQLNGSEEFDYDALGRVNKITTKVTNTVSSTFLPFVTEYTYNAENRITQKKSPTGNIYNYIYNSLGYLDNISKGSQIIYHSPTVYSSGFQKDYTLGFTTISKTYDDFNRIKTISSPYINDEYTWDPVNSNLTFKNENKHNLLYSYEYDNFERLEKEILTSKGITNDLGYLDNGNIDWKTSSGNYEYHTGKQFAVKTMNDCDIVNNKHSEKYQTVSYTSFNKPSFIRQGSISIGIQYNHGLDRSCATINLNTFTSNRINRYYIGNTEIDYTYNGMTNTFKHSIDYIYADDELVAMDVKEAGKNPKLWYVQTDYQGTIRSVFDDNNANYSVNFDAWGVIRDQTSGALIHNQKPVGFPDWLYRGYTGHEHYYELGLINLNARLYDPHNSRVLSPDIFVQANTVEGFNRFSYCNNNPLKYTDPDGNLFVIDDLVLGLAVGGINLYSNFDKVGSIGQGLAYFGVGFAAGATSTYISPILSASLMGALNKGIDIAYQKKPISTSEAIQEIGIAALTDGALAYVTGGVSKVAKPYLDKVVGKVASPVIKEALSQGIIGAGINGTGAAIEAGINGDNVGTAFISGAGHGLAAGLITGSLTGSRSAKENGKNPWTGEPKIEPIPEVETPVSTSSSGAHTEEISCHQEGGFSLDDVRLMDNPMPTMGEKISTSDVFTVTHDGVVLPPGYDIPKRYVENPKRKSSYGTFDMETGKFKELLRIDKATPKGKMGGDRSHFHKNGNGRKYYNLSSWPH